MGAAGSRLTPGSAVLSWTVGVTPVQLREAIYQRAPFIGFTETPNAVAVLKEVSPR